jgi:hypothetical protein
MMAITEDSVVAGIMTFLFYGVLPVALIMYVAGTGNRKRRRAQEEAERRAQKLSEEASTTAKSESPNPN